MIISPITRAWTSIRREKAIDVPCSVCRVRIVAVESWQSAYAPLPQNRTSIPLVFTWMALIIRNGCAAACETRTHSLAGWFAAHRARMHAEILGSYKMYSKNARLPIHFPYLHLEKPRAHTHHSAGSAHAESQIHKHTSAGWHRLYRVILTLPVLHQNKTDHWVYIPK